MDQLSDFVAWETIAAPAPEGRKVMKRRLTPIGVTIPAANLLWVGTADCGERRLGKDDLAPCLEASGVDSAPRRQAAPPKASRSRTSPRNKTP